MKLYKYIKFSFLLILFLLVFSCNKRTKWYESFREKDKSPFGTFILHNEAKILFQNNDVVYLKDNIYNYLIDNYDYEDGNFANYVCIKANAHKVEAGFNDIKTFVEKGNNAFLSLNTFLPRIQEDLGFELTNLDAEAYTTQQLKELKGDLLLNNQKFNTNKFEYDRNLRRNYFSSIDDRTTEVLGTQSIDGELKPVFIKVYYGDGAFYLHSQPIAFTNYYLLKDNFKYAENVFSYLPDKTILWDPHIKSYYDNDDFDSPDTKSVFGFFWQNPSLKWSLYLFFFGLLLFMLFNARRKQRPIPIIEKLKNSTVEFTHTIANLYFKENNHKNVVDKKITYFLEKVRRNYLINTNNLNQDFVEKLASKSGNDIQKTSFLINTIIALNKKQECTQNELFRLNTLIDNFFQAK